MNINSTIKLRTGNMMPVTGLGTWELTIDTSNTVLYALKLGYHLMDTSSDYLSQPGIGNAIKKSGISRESLYIVTKVEETDEDAYVRTQSNLQELDLDYIDLMLIHRPPSIGTGEDLWEGLIKTKKEGLTIDIGVSNYSTELIDELIEESKEVPVVNEIEWSPFGYNEEMKKYCDKNKIVIMAYSPLTRGERLDDAILMELADKYKKSAAQILIRWNLQLGVIPIPKANQKNHQKENIDVFDFEITEEDMKTLNDLNEEYSSLGSLSYV